MRAAILALAVMALSVAGCGSSGGACSDAVTLTYQGTSYTASCWVLTATNGLNGTQLYSTTGSARVHIYLMNDQGNGCTFSAGKTVQLGDPCLSITANSVGDGGMFMATAGQSAGGSLNISSWGTGNGSTVTVTFSSNSELAAAGGGTVPISGTASGTAGVTPK